MGVDITACLQKRATSWRWCSQLDTEYATKTPAVLTPGDRETFRDRLTDMRPAFPTHRRDRARALGRRSGASASTSRGYRLRRESGGQGGTIDTNCIGRRQAS